MNEKRLMVIISSIVLMLFLIIFNIFYLREKKLPEIIPFQQAKKIENIFNETIFLGVWNLKEKSDLLNEQQGISNFQFFFPSKKNSKKEFKNFGDIFSNNLRYFLVEFRDPKYNDGNKIIMEKKVFFQNSTQEDVNLYTLSLNNTKPKYAKTVYDVERKKNLEMKWRKNCTIKGSIKLNKGLFTKIGLNTTYLKKEENIININLKSENSDCKININTNVSYKKEENKYKILFYFYFVCFIIFLNILGALRILKKIEIDPNYCFKFSLVTIEFTMLQDVFFLLFHLVFASLFYRINFLLLFISFFFIVLFSFFDNRILIYIWKFQVLRNRNYLNERDFQKKLLMYQTKIYLYLIVYNVAMCKLFLNPHLIFLNSFILIPQIVHNIIYPSTSEFNFFYLFNYVGSKYFIFLYLRGLPTSIFEIRNYLFEILLGVLVLGIQFMILYVQDQHGAKFFLPKFLKNTHNYFIDIKNFKKRKLSQKKNNSESRDNLNESSFSENNSLCAICLGDLFEVVNEIKDLKIIQNKHYQKILKKVRKNKIMLSPCDHAFHPECLFKWMEIRMECPCCRKVLPLIN